LVSLNAFVVELLVNEDYLKRYRSKYFILKSNFTLPTALGIEEAAENSIVLFQLFSRYFLGGLHYLWAVWEAGLSNILLRSLWKIA